MGYAVTKPTRRAMDITNQNAGPKGSPLAGKEFFAKIIVGTIPAMRQFIDNNSGRKVLDNERAYEPPASARIKRAWKIVQPEPKPNRYSNVISVTLDRWKELAITAPTRIPTPSHCHVALMQSRQRLAAAEYVKKGANWSCVCSKQYEAPFENRGFGRTTNIRCYKQ